MPGINVTIQPNGRSFKVHDACTEDSTACVAVWDTLFSSFSAKDDSTFELTETFHQNEELPELEEEIELDGSE